MFRSKTVFILGAGASHEVKLPVGEKLKHKIAGLVGFKFEGHILSSGHHSIYDAIKRTIGNPLTKIAEWPAYHSESTKMSEALPLATSIDHYLDAHKGNKVVELCGKLGIVNAIVEAELKSSLYLQPLKRDSKLNFSLLEPTWFVKLSRLLFEGVSKSEVSKVFQNFSIINFNYDRCVQHFLFHSLQVYYGITRKEAADLVNAIEIFHPYGTIGKLPFVDGDQGVGFGSEDHDILKLSGNIKTFTEQVEDEKSLTRMRELVIEAKTLVFLGFAFHRQNMELICPGQGCAALRVLGTALNISRSDCALIQSDISNSFGILKERIELRNDLVCGKLMDEYSRSLTA